MQQKRNPYGGGRTEDNDATGREGRADHGDPHPGGREDVDSAAQLMVRSLADYGYHPVIFCGTSASGKTTAMASLCCFYLQRGGAIRFGAWPSDGGSAEHQARLQQAKAFYHQVVDDFSKGIGPTSTGSSWPYIVPIELEPMHESEPLTAARGQSVGTIRVAFIDMGGELFKPTSVEDRGGHRLGDVQQLLRIYTPSVSMLYFAPTTRKRGYDHAAREAAEPHHSPDATQRVREDPDLALRNALDAYIASRLDRSRDRHLYALSKWDLARRVDDDSFAQPDPIEVESGYLLKHFPNSWGTFRSMRVGPRAKWWTQYCAGVLSDRERTIFDADSPTGIVLDRYSMALWNWIYRGATRDAAAPEGRILFPELQPPSPKPWFRSFSARK